MKFVQMFVIFVIIITFEMATATATATATDLNDDHLANRKQQDLIESSIDLSSNPCDDFFQYACGEWENSHQEAGEKYHDTLSLMDYNANKEMAAILDRIDLESQPDFVNRAYDFYKSCKDVQEYKTLHYLNWITERENLNFPTIWRSRTTREKFDWLRTLAVLRTYGLNGIFIQETVVPRRVNSSRFIIELDKPVARGGFPALTLDNLEQIINSLGMPPGSTNILKLWTEVHEFESELKTLDDFDDEIDSDEEYDEDWPFKKLKDITLPWLEDYLRILLNKTELNPNMKIHLKKVPYFEALDKLVKQHSQRFLCKYLEIRFLWFLHKQANANLTAEMCLSHVRSSLPLAMDWLYEQQHPELQLEFPKITAVYDDIRTHFTEMIQKTDNRVGLLDKIKNMQLKLNNIPRKNTVSSLEKFYDHLNINDGEFYANHLKLMKFKFEAEHKFLKKTKPKDLVYLENTNKAASSAPYLSRSSNTVVVPLTFLQPPIYQPGSGSIYKYSTLGYLLAREMFHGFDNDNLDFTNPLFTESFDCLIETEPAEEQEVIADISGLRYAYQMFNDSSTDDIDVSSSQLFFLNFAQIFCGTSTASDKNVTLANHNSARQRISDILRHYSEYSNVFQCNSTDAMYNACEVLPSDDYVYN